MFACQLIDLNFVEFRAFNSIKSIFFETFIKVALHKMADRFFYQQKTKINFHCNSFELSRKTDMTDTISRIIFSSKLEANVFHFDQISFQMKLNDFGRKEKKNQDTHTQMTNWPKRRRRWREWCRWWPHLIRPRKANAAILPTDRLNFLRDPLIKRDWNEGNGKQKEKMEKTSPRFEFNQIPLAVRQSTLIPDKSVEG